MRTVTGLLLGLTTMVSLTAGCATAPAGGTSANAGGGRDSAATPYSATPDAGACPTSASATLTITEADTGRTVCALVSQRIELYLHGTADRPWSALTTSGTQLRRAPSGKLSLAIGVTGAVFTAVAPGQAEVTSTRPGCTTQPNGADCGATSAFRVVVSVHS